MKIGEIIFMWLKKGFIRINRIKEELIENQWGVKIEKRELYFVRDRIAKVRKRK